jgi:hypothetical protein
MLARGSHKYYFIQLVQLIQYWIYTHSISSIYFYVCVKDNKHNFLKITYINKKLFDFACMLNVRANH